MKIYGYGAHDAQVDGARPKEMAEITLVAAPSELRRIATFLSAAASGMEQMGPRYSHEHLADHQQGFDSSPQLIVFSPDSAK